MKYLMESKPISVFAATLLTLGAGLFLAKAANASEFQMLAHSIDEVADGTMPMVQDISATEAVI